MFQSNGGVDIVTGFNMGYRGNKNILRGKRKNITDGIAERTEYERSEGWISCSWKRMREATIGNDF